MSQRRFKRALQQAAKKRAEKIELERRAIVKNGYQHFDHNPFDEVQKVKKFWLFYYIVKGLKVAPMKMIKGPGFAFSHRYDTLVLTVFKWSLVVKDWTMRRKTKPKGSIGNYIVSWQKK